MLAHKRGGKDAGLSIDGQEERPMLGHEHSNRIMQEDDTEVQADKKYKRRPTSIHESTLHLLRQYHQRHGTVRMLFTASIICVLLSIVIYFCYFYSLDPKTVGVELMECTHRIFTKHNITYFFDYGTLLGAIRHKGFIPWDDQMDIDVGVLASQTDLINSVKQVFKDENCGYMIHRSDVSHLPGITSFVIKRGAFRIFYHRFIPLYIDIADYEEVPRPEGLKEEEEGGKEEGKEKEIFYKDTHHPDLPISFSSKQLLPPSECEFEGHTFHCPHNPGYVLERQFGKDWMTPKKDFKPEDVTEENRIN